MRGNSKHNQHAEFKAQTLRTLGQSTTTTRTSTSWVGERPPLRTRSIYGVSCVVSARAAEPSSSLQWYTRSSTINDSQRLVHQTTILSNNEDSRNSRIADTRSNQKSSKSRGYYTRTPIQNEANGGWGFQVDELQLGQTQQQLLNNQPTQQQHNELRLGTMTTLKLRKDDHHCQRITFYLLVTLASYHATMLKQRV